jgi:hypothetical protein
MPINPNPPTISSGDKTTVQYSPTNYTPTTEEHTTSDNQLTAHLYGVDTAIGGKSATSHNHDSSYSATSHTHSYTTVGKCIAVAMVFS